MGKSIPLFSICRDLRPLGSPRGWWRSPEVEELSSEQLWTLQQRCTGLRDIRGALPVQLSLGCSCLQVALVCSMGLHTNTEEEKAPFLTAVLQSLKESSRFVVFFFVFENGCFPLTKFALLFMCRLDLFALLPSLLWTSKLLSGGPTLVLNVLINFHLKLLPCFSVSPGPASAQGLKDITWSFQTGGGFKKSNTAFQCWERNVCLPFAAQYMNLLHFEFWLCIDVFFV